MLNQNGGRMKYWLLLLLIISGSSFGLDLHSLPRTTIGVEEQVGGTEDQFAKQVGGVLQRYSVRTGYEACADICKTADGWSAKIVSIGSHMSCSTTRKCDRGCYQTLIHSHPTERSFEANSMDERISRQGVKAGQVLAAEDPRDFSEQDYTIPGYMVVYGQVWHQQGKGTERLIGPIER